MSNLEGFSTRGMELGDDPEGIKETNNDLNEQYMEAVRMLADEKAKNEYLFQGLLNSTITRLISLGLNVTKESILKDVELELYRRGVSQDNNLENVSGESLNMNLDEIMAKLDETRGMVAEMRRRIDQAFEISPKSVQETAPAPVVTPEEKASIQEKAETFRRMAEEQSKLVHTLEQAKLQPNEPQTVHLGGQPEPLPEWTKDRGISGYTEPSLDQIKAGFLSQKPTQPSTPSAPPIIVVESDKEKAKLIDDIITGMNNAGEFSNTGSDIIAKMNDISAARTRLQTKSLDELTLLHKSYQKGDEQKSDGGMRM